MDGMRFLILWGCYCSVRVYPADYPPDSRTNVPDPSQFRMHDFQEEYITTPDGVKLHMYVIYARKSSARFDIRSFSSTNISDYTLLYFHGNGGNMGHRLPVAAQFLESLKCNIVMLSYRGYGKSEGKPDETGLKTDSYCALDFIKQHPLLKSTRVVLYGQSLGGAVAVHLASKRSPDIAGLIIENTFLSLPKLIPHLMPMLRYLSFLCHQVWDSESDIQLVDPTVPMLFLSGSRDQLIPQSHLRQLYVTAARSMQSKDRRLAVVQWSEFPNGAHDDTCIQSGYFEAIQEFWCQHIVEPAAL
ncbi:Alpha/Beta hydrolase protein [Polychytrium aggregatum]|uniref:Alpha/Beta hydrolase protein n=1 Tax=Polychytrium aggregatum TaxID=110093 RepID=UPI0022FED84F|nr:Alpha/Beta hydrolase protein [Polychytrium aggregatum]KAI9206486.1 Alpha/Beta hydrolase protein [Polychytrium aggregatum]